MSESGAFPRTVFFDEKPVARWTPDGVRMQWIVYALDGSWFRAIRSTGCLIRVLKEMLPVAFARRRLADVVKSMTSEEAAVVLDLLEERGLIPVDRGEV